MSIKSILFHTEDVRATLDARKTVKRMLINPQPTYSKNSGFAWKGEAYGTDLPPTIKGAAHNFLHCAPYQIGDTIYVRETFDCIPGCAVGDIGNDKCYFYKADGDHRPIGWRAGWKPSIHMPRDAARIWLRVTDIRVERLKDMKNKDAKREGVRVETDNSGIMRLLKFAEIWDSKIKPSNIDIYGWNANPWVWVVEFERCEKPEEV